MKQIINQSVVLSLIISLVMIPGFSTMSLAEEREIPESMKHLFACDETISLNEILQISNKLENSNRILISGKVNFEDGRAVNLGIQKGYPAIMWVYHVNPFPSDYRLVMSDGVHISDNNSFVFAIPENELQEGKFIAYIFYGIPKESMQNSKLTGKTEFFIGMDNDEFEKQKYKIMREYLGADDIRRLQLEKIKESNSINSQSFCTN